MFTDKAAQESHHSSAEESYIEKCKFRYCNIKQVILSVFTCSVILAFIWLYHPLFLSFQFSSKIVLQSTLAYLIERVRRLLIFNMTVKCQKWHLSVCLCTF